MSPEISGVQGSVSQVRAELSCSWPKPQHSYLYRRSCDQGRNLGGLEHMVDTVLFTLKGSATIPSESWEQSKTVLLANEIKFLRCNQVAWLRFLIRVKFSLEERLDGATGSSIVVTMEGTRPAEVQALVTPDYVWKCQENYNRPWFHRASWLWLFWRNGQVCFSPKNQDAYLKSAGGVTRWILLLIWLLQLLASSYKGQANQPARKCFVGELMGEVRRVNLFEQRINEAAKLGLPRFMCLKILWRGSRHHQVSAVGVSTLAEVLKKVF